MNEIRIIFDGPPSHESGRFVEVEDADGHSIKAGTWHEREDGLWELRIHAKLFTEAIAVDEPDDGDML